jgi:hypothetical protein
MRLQLSRPASFRFLGVLAADMSADQLQERRGVRITFIENTAASVFKTTISPKQSIVRNLG